VFFLRGHCSTSAIFDFFSALVIDIAQNQPRTAPPGAVKSASDRDNPESPQPISVGVAGNTPPYGPGTSRTARAG
jgi:hypothetical protein